RGGGQGLPPNRAVSGGGGGLAHLWAVRPGKGILTKAGITENTSLASLARYVRNGFLSNAARRRAAEKYVGEFSVRAANLGANLEFFSGGNQQKVSLAKCLDTEPRVLIFDEPTRGIDIKAKSDIYRFIQALARTGMACILISSEMEEIIGLCHRVLVLHEGEATGVLEAGAITEEEIMLHATKLKTTESARTTAAGEGGR
ncbi:MAG: ATP-binding cassette domain-containing protein, partial [Planctomycetes bacterium]|nr:ATP-binding cassette domain-containing protein [Planctomycetota bacterium]